MVGLTEKTDISQILQQWGSSSSQGSEPNM